MNKLNNHLTLQLHVLFDIWSKEEKKTDSECNDRNQHEAAWLLRVQRCKIIITSLSNVSQLKGRNATLPKHPLAAVHQYN